MTAPRPPDVDEDTVELLLSGYRYALSLTHHKENAEDLVQEAFLKLFRRYGPVISRSLLVVSIRRLFIDRLRQGQRTPITDVVPADETFAAVSVHSGTATDLDSLLATLRPAEREVLCLHHVEGYTAQQIAELTDTPRNSVLSLMSRALKKLQSAVSQTL